MTEGEFPFRSFTMRSEGYDQGEVDSYVSELQNEIIEQRRVLDAATTSSGGDTRLHDPEGAVTRTLAIAQETADRVLHDAQVEADRRRTEADEHATTVVADADERAARLLGDMEAQAAEVREQGVAAARSAIQVERDKAMAELAHVRRVRDDLRTEAVDLKAALDQYRSQAREASDTLAAAASGPLASMDLPDFIDDDVVLAGIASTTDAADEEAADMVIEADEGDMIVGDDTMVDDTMGDDTMVDEVMVDDTMGDDSMIDDSVIDQTLPTDAAFAGDDEAGNFLRAVGDEDDFDDDLADVILIDADNTEVRELVDYEPSIDGDGDDDSIESDFGGTFLAEVRAAADGDTEDDTVAPRDDDESDRFLSELRGLSEEASDDLNSDVADRFFDDDR